MVLHRRRRGNRSYDEKKTQTNLFFVNIVKPRFTVYNFFPPNCELNHKKMRSRLGLKSHNYVLKTQDKKIGHIMIHVWEWAYQVLEKRIFDTLAR